MYTIMETTSKGTALRQHTKNNVLHVLNVCMQPHYFMAQSIQTDFQPHAFSA